MKAYIEGADKLILKLNKIKNLQNTQLFNIMQDNVAVVEDAAKMLAPTNSGGLRMGIFSKMDTKDSEIIGIVETNSEHAMYVEFGTGPKGQADHDGISPNVNPVYTSEGWVIPATAISEKDAEQYHMIPYIKQGSIIGYFSRGQAANPFMYPALKNNEKIIIKRTKERLKDELKRIANDK